MAYYDNVLIKEVLDGDTVILDNDVKVRFWGIDAPETDQPFGIESKRHLMDLIGNIETATINVDVGFGADMPHDKYGRFLGVLYLSGDPKSLNEKMVEDGYAWVYEHFCEPSTPCDDWRALQDAAQSTSLGLWGAEEDPIPPWEWRAQQDLALVFDIDLAENPYNLTHLAWVFHYLARQWKQGNQSSPLLDMVYADMNLFSISNEKDSTSITNLMKDLLSGTSINTIGQLYSKINSSPTVLGDQSAIPDVDANNITHIPLGYQVSQHINLANNTIMAASGIDTILVFRLLREFIDVGKDFFFFNDEIQSLGYSRDKILLFSSFVLNLAFYRALNKNYPLYKANCLHYNLGDTEYTDARDNIASLKSVALDLNGYSHNQYTSKSRYEFYLRRFIKYFKILDKMNLYADGCDDVDEERDDCYDVLYSVKYDIAKQYMQDGKNDELLIKVTIAWYKTFYDAIHNNVVNYDDPIKIIGFGPTDQVNEMGVVTKSLAPNTTVRDTRQYEITRAFLNRGPARMTPLSFKTIEIMSNIVGSNFGGQYHPGWNEAVNPYSWMTGKDVLAQDGFSFNNQKALWIYPRSSYVYVRMGFSSSSNQNTTYNDYFQYYITIEQDDPAYFARLNMYDLNGGLGTLSSNQTSPFYDSFKVLYSKVKSSNLSSSISINISQSSGTKGYNLFDRYHYIRADDPDLEKVVGLQYDFDNIIKVDFVTSTYIEKTKTVAESTVGNIPEYSYVDTSVYDIKNKELNPPHLKITVDRDMLFKYFSNVKASCRKQYSGTNNSDTVKLNIDNMAIWVDLYRGLIYFIDTSDPRSEVTGSEVDLSGGHVYLTFMSFSSLKNYGIFGAEIMPGDSPNNEAVHMLGATESTGMLGHDYGGSTVYSTYQAFQETINSRWYNQLYNNDADLSAGKIIISGNDRYGIAYNYKPSCESYSGKILDPITAYYDINTVDKFLIYTGKQTVTYSDSFINTFGVEDTQTSFFYKPPSFLPSFAIPASNGGGFFPIRYSVRTYTNNFGINYYYEYKYNPNSDKEVSDRSLDLHYKNPYETDILPIFDNNEASNSIWSLHDGITSEIINNEINSINVKYTDEILSYDPVGYAIKKVMELVKGPNDRLLSRISIVLLTGALVGITLKVTGVVSVGLLGSAALGVFGAAVLAALVVYVVFKVISIVNTFKQARNQIVLGAFRRRLGSLSYTVFYNGYIRSLFPMWKGFRFFDYTSIDAFVNEYEKDEVDRVIGNRDWLFQSIPSAASESPYIGDLLYGVNDEMLSVDTLDSSTNTIPDTNYNYERVGVVNVTGHLGGYNVTPTAYRLEKDEDNGYYDLLENVGVRIYTYEMSDASGSNPIIDIEQIINNVPGYSITLNFIYNATDNTDIANSTYSAEFTNAEFGLHRPYSYLMEMNNRLGYLGFYGIAPALIRMPYTDHFYKRPICRINIYEG